MPKSSLWGYLYVNLVDLVTFVASPKYKKNWPKCELRGQFR